MRSHAYTCKSYFLVIDWCGNSHTLPQPGYAYDSLCNNFWCTIIIKIFFTVASWSEEHKVMKSAGRPVNQIINNSLNILIIKINVIILF